MTQCLTAYLQADPLRARIAAAILDRLDEAGNIGMIARYYITRNRTRRLVFRGICGAIGCPCPLWTRECRAAANINRAFIAEHREAYNTHRRAMRLP